MSWRRKKKKKLGAPTLALLGSIVIFVVPEVTAVAADPPAGTVGPGNRKIAWDGRYFAAARTFFGPDQCPPERDPDDTLCDHFMLMVDVDPKFWKSHEGGVRVSIKWELHENSFLLHVYQGGAVVASSTASNSRVQEVIIPRATGAYEVRVTPEVVQDSGYRGTATFTAHDPKPRIPRNQAYHGVRITGANPKEEPQSTPAGRWSPPLALQVVDVGRNAGEPTIGIDATGTAFYAATAVDGVTTPLPNQPRTRLLRSTDGGLIWEDISPEFAPGVVRHQGTFDPYLYVDGTSGRVFFLDLHLAGSLLSVSDDGGESFETLVIRDVAGGINDRPSLTSGPVPEGVPFTTLDPEFDEIVYYCVNSVPLPHAGCSRSLDGGRTFTPTGDFPFPPDLDTETGMLCGASPRELETDRKGRVFVPGVRCPDATSDVLPRRNPQIPVLAVSEDAGQTWHRSEVSDTVLALIAPTGQTGASEVAADVDGNLFFLWVDDRHRLPYLATSTDLGRTWSDPLMIAPPGVREAALADIIAGDEGRIAVTFIGSLVADEEDFTRPWNSYVAISINALDENPRFLSAVANPPRDPVYRGKCVFQCAGLLDFLDIQLSPLDGSVWATAVDGCTRIERCKRGTAPGVDETGEIGAVVDSRGIAIRQLSGPWLLESLP